VKPAAAAALATVLAAAGCAAGPRAGTRTVVVEGWAPMGAAPRPETLRQAVADARRRAVEEAAGVEVSAVSSVDDAGLIKERVSTAGHGTVLSSRVLSEKVRDGMLTVKVSARVALPKAGEPRRAGWIPGTGPSARFVAVRADVRAALRGAWTNYGGSSADADGRADVVMNAVVEESLLDEPRLKPFVAVRVRLSAEASDARGAVLWLASREASSLGLDPAQARTRALAAAADAVAQAAADDLPARLWLTARADAR
jgi:hypothetical protein